MRTLVLWCLGAALVATHLAPPVRGGATLVFGVWPEELAFRLAWMAAATLFVVGVTSRPRGGDA